MCTKWPSPDLPMPLYEETRRQLIGARTNDDWEALGGHLLIQDPEGGERYTDGIELFFTFLFAQLT